MFYEYISLIAQKVTVRCTVLYIVVWLVFGCSDICYWGSTLSTFSMKFPTGSGMQFSSIMCADEGVPWLNDYMFLHLISLY